MFTQLYGNSRKLGTSLSLSTQGGRDGHARERPQPGHHAATTGSELRTHTQQEGSQRDDGD